VQYEHTDYEPWMDTGYYRGAGDNSLLEKQIWFDDPETYELVTRSRPFTCLYHSIFSTNLAREENARMLDANIEKQIVWRSVHSYLKTVTMANRLIVGVLSVPDWAWYINYHR